MEFTINLRISADASLISLLNGVKTGTGTPRIMPPVKLEAVEDLDGDTAPSKVSVEELREVASSLMVKNKSALKEILTKYKAKTVAVIDESDYTAALADMKKAMK